MAPANIHYHMFDLGEKYMNIHLQNYGRELNKVSAKTNKHNHQYTFVQIRNGANTSLKYQGNLQGSMGLWLKSCEMGRIKKQSLKWNVKNGS